MFPLFALFKSERQGLLCLQHVSVTAASTPGLTRPFAARCHLTYTHIHAHAHALRRATLPMAHTPTQTHTQHTPPQCVTTPAQHTKLHTYTHTTTWRVNSRPRMFLCPHSAGVNPNRDAKGGVVVVVCSAREEGGMTKKEDRQKESGKLSFSMCQSRRCQSATRILTIIGCHHSVIRTVRAEAARR